MITITFKNYDKNNKLDILNKRLIQNSKDRYELRIAKNGVAYLYDYDWKELIRNKKEIYDILEIMGCEIEGVL